MTDQERIKDLEAQLAAEKRETEFQYKAGMIADEWRKKALDDLRHLQKRWTMHIEWIADDIRVVMFGPNCSIMIDPVESDCLACLRKQELAYRAVSELIRGSDFLPMNREGCELIAKAARKAWADD